MPPFLALDKRTTRWSTPGLASWHETTAGDWIVKQSQAIVCEPMDLADFVKLTSAGAGVVEQHATDPMVVWVLIGLADGRRFLISERTYRPGTSVIADPTEDELEAARRDPWAAWNAARKKSLGTDGEPGPSDDLIRREP